MYIRRTILMKKYPFILIFDIDNTVIGDCSLLTKEAKLIEYIYNTCKKNGDHNCKYIKGIDMQKELKSGLLRPNIKDFIKFCNNKFKNVEIFFYTGSSYYWTNSSLGPNIEKALNIKINRPFFTKENMITTLANLEKSLANIFPLITKSLEKKYPVMKNDNDVDYIIKNRTIFIDDIKNNTYTYENRQFVCPRYNYWPAYDVSKKIVKKYGIDRKVFDNKDILKYMWDNNIYIYNKNGNNNQKNKAISKKIKSEYIKKSRLSKNNDTYYRDLIKELSNKEIDSGIISDNNIKSINYKLSDI